MGHETKLDREHKLIDRDPDSKHVNSMQQKHKHRDMTERGHKSHLIKLTGPDNHRDSKKEKHDGDHK